MTNSPHYRFYSFVPGLYLSALQCGLQTAHAITEMYGRYVCYSGERTSPMKIFDAWAQTDKTIIILNAGDCKGVLDTYYTLEAFGGGFELPSILFKEDKNSLNGAPTAAGIIVPDFYYDTVYDDQAGPAYFFSRLDHLGHMTELKRYPKGFEEYEFIKFLKGFTLV